MFNHRGNDAMAKEVKTSVQRGLIPAEKERPDERHAAVCVQKGKASSQGSCWYPRDPNSTCVPSL